MVSWFRVSGLGLRSFRGSRSLGVHERTSPSVFSFCAASSGVKVRPNPVSPSPRRANNTPPPPPPPPMPPAMPPPMPLLMLLRSPPRVNANVATTSNAQPMSAVKSAVPALTLPPPPWRDDTDASPDASKVISRVLPTATPTAAAGEDADAAESPSRRCVSELPASTSPRWVDADAIAECYRAARYVFPLGGWLHRPALHCPDLRPVL